MNFDGVCSLWGETYFIFADFSIYVGIYGDLWGKVGKESRARGVPVCRIRRCGDGSKR